MANLQSPSVLMEHLHVRRWSVLENSQKLEERMRHMLSPEPRSGNKVTSLVPTRSFAACPSSLSLSLSLSLPVFEAYTVLSIQGVWVHKTLLESQG